MRKIELADVFNRAVSAYQNWSEGEEPSVEVAREPFLISKAFELTGMFNGFPRSDELGSEFAKIWTNPKNIGNPCYADASKFMLERIETENASIGTVHYGNCDCFLWTTA